LYLRTFIIIFREDDLIYDEKLDPVMRKIEIARFVAPKIAYQWFSCVLSPSWWSHFWLYDGLATLFAEEAIVKVSITNIATISIIYLKILYIIFII